MATELFFLELIEGLKNTLRRGWYLRNVPNPESVSDHMYRMAIMCLLVHGLDEETRKKAVYMALIHDMGEALVGDITPSDGISREEKYTREEMAFKFLACTLRSSHPTFADSILDLWHEYENRETQAAMLVHQIDKLECLNQAVIYEQRTGIDLDEFMELEEKISLPQLRPLLDACLQKRKEVALRQQAGLTVVFVSGGPGVGKGTQCTRLAEEFGFSHISVGDLLREEAKRPESPYREFIPESIRKSVLLPAQLTTQLLALEMDGFLRSIAQAKDFGHKLCMDYVTISLDCSEADLQQRLEHRSRSSNRLDDNPDIITRRLQTFNENNRKVLEYLQTYGLVFHIGGGGLIEEVYTLLRASI
ncbi:cytidylate kinase [Lophiotrema nucula]|uniref:5'-deoxynucleotidase n=1 Tax=Lophiotrema nucula TaxID=690887 RepID=A0A6A5Z2M8_9PLEO|nr:cytidylate kinase [Lophiotrema nucula]